MTDVAALWVYLSGQPLLWLTLTIATWVVTERLSILAGRHPLANPVIWTVFAMAAILALSGTPYRTYFAGAQFIHFLLGPATVALAAPLAKNWTEVRPYLVPMSIALVVGSLTAIGSAVGLGVLFGLPHVLLAALAPKSVTAGVAMALTTKAGGDPSLAAVLVIVTGALGAVIVTPFMNLLRIRDYRARGFAVGLVAHGIGTARAYAVDSTAGLFAGCAMCLNAILTSVLFGLYLG